MDSSDERKEQKKNKNSNEKNKDILIHVLIERERKKRENGSWFNDDNCPVALFPLFAVAVVVVIAVVEIVEHNKLTDRMHSLEHRLVVVVEFVELDHI